MGSKLNDGVSYMINALVILILIFAWITPVIVTLLHRRKIAFKYYAGAIGSAIIGLLLVIYLILSKVIALGTSVETKGLALIALYLVIIGYGLVGYRSFIKARLGKPDQDSRYNLLLFLLVGILGIILVNLLPLIIVSWFVIVIIIYRLITYKDIDLEARQDYRERLKKDYLDRF